MLIAVLILSTQAVFGAFDTLYYHEFRARLAWKSEHRRELLLHAMRDFAYGFLFLVFAWWQFHGALVLVLCAVLLFEIVITLLDFLEEDMHRPLFAGERVTHTIMAILYGGFLAYLIPELYFWWEQPAGIATADYAHREYLAPVLTAFAVGVTGSGIRDLIAWYRLGKPA